MFFLKSQFELLGIKDLYLFNKIKNNVKITNLPIKSISDNKNKMTEEMKKYLHINNIIWMGGNYFNSMGNYIILTEYDILNSLNKILTTIKPGESVAIMLMPRLFNNNNKHDNIELLKK